MPPPLHALRQRKGGGGSAPLQIPAGDAEDNDNVMHSFHQPVRRRRRGRRLVGHAHQQRRGKKGLTYICAAIGVLTVFVMTAVVVFRQPLQDVLVTGSNGNRSGEQIDTTTLLDRREKRKLRRRQQAGGGRLEDVINGQESRDGARREQLKQRGERNTRHHHNDKVDNKNERNRHRAAAATDPVHAHQQPNKDNGNYSKFTCPDGSTGYLNDNYCDCSDGSDEPATSACSNILVQKPVFKCADGRGEIYASRVQDGIKDCADGSDEVF